MRRSSTRDLEAEKSRYLCSRKIISDFARVAKEATAWGSAIAFGSGNLFAGFALAAVAVCFAGIEEKAYEGYRRKQRDWNGVYVPERPVHSSIVFSLLARGAHALFR